MTRPSVVGADSDHRSGLEETIAACSRRRRTFFRYALPLFAIDFLAPAVVPALLDRNVMFMFLLLLLPLPIACVLTWRLLRAACPWCSRLFFLRTRASRTPLGKHLAISTLLEKELRCANCGVEFDKSG
jgi:hypothetical protein